MRIGLIVVSTLMIGLLMWTYAPRAISASNLYDHEASWPNHIKLVESLENPDGSTLVPAGRVAVLVRVREDGLLRADFGRMGRHIIDPKMTDVVERANALRRGKGHKMGPNLTLAIGTKLVDAAAESPVPYRFRDETGNGGVLCVFADPSDEGFEALARLLAPFGQREGVTTVLFPRTDQGDAKTAARLRELEWVVPFAFNNYAEPIARSLMPEGAEFPWVQLATDEGRIVVEGPVDDALAEHIARAMDADFAALR